MSIQNPGSGAAFLHKETFSMHFTIPETAAARKIPFANPRERLYNYQRNN